MKKFLAIGLLIGAGINAGGNQSSPKPFGGFFGWRAVRLDDNQNVCTISPYNYFRKWDFEGTQVLIDGNEHFDGLTHSTSTNTHFFCIGDQGNTVIKIPFDGTNAADIKMKNPIQTNVGATESEIIILDSSGNIIVCDYDGNPCEVQTKDLFKNKFDTNARIQVIDNRSLAIYTNSHLHKYNLKTQQLDYEIELGNENPIRKILFKATKKDHLIAVRPHKGIENTEFIEILDKGEVVQSFQNKTVQNTSLDEDLLAVQANGKVKLYDVNTGQQTYEGSDYGIGGASDMKLEKDLLFLVGRKVAEKSRPGSVVIDTRQKPQQEEVQQ